MSAKKREALSEAQLLERLRVKYTEKNGNGDAWSFIPKVRSASGFDARRTIDAYAMALWPSRGLLLTAFEIKSSRSDDWRIAGGRAIVRRKPSYNGVGSRAGYDRAYSRPPLSDRQRRVLYALTDVPQKPREIVARAGLDGQMASELRALSQRGPAIRGGEGWLPYGETP